LDLVLYDFLTFVSIRNSSVTFILDTAPVLRSVLLAKTPVVRYPNVGEDFYTMNTLNIWLDKELGLDVTGSVWVIDL